MSKKSKKGGVKKIKFTPSFWPPSRRKWDLIIGQVPKNGQKPGGFRGVEKKGLFLGFFGIFVKNKNRELRMGKTRKCFHRDAMCFYSDSVEFGGWEKVVKKVDFLGLKKGRKNETIFYSTNKYFYLQRNKNNYLWNKK